MPTIYTHKIKVRPIKAEELLLVDDAKMVRIPTRSKTSKDFWNEYTHIERTVATKFNTNVHFDANAHIDIWYDY